MKLEKSTKKLLVVFGALVLVYVGIEVYYTMEEKKEIEYYQQQMEKVYAENPALREEHEQRAALIRLYGPSALAQNFNADNVEANTVARKNEKLDDGFEKTTVYYDDGQPREEFMMKDDMLEGVFKHWNQAGQLLEESNYKNNLLNGPQKSFYTNGSLKTETNYVDGKKSGLMTSWYQNGKKSKEVNYVDNKIMGSTSFYLDGETRMKETLNSETGILLTEGWYNNGQLSHFFSTKDGKKEGRMVKNTPSGFKVAEADYKNGVNDGWCRIWNDSGELDVELFYNNGQIDRTVEALGQSCDIDIWRFGFR